MPLSIEEKMAMFARNVLVEKVLKGDLSEGDFVEKGFLMEDAVEVCNFIRNNLS